MSNGNGFEGSIKLWELTNLQFTCTWIRYFSLPWLPLLRRRFRHRKFISMTNDAILHMSATDLAEAIRKQEITSVMVIQCYVDRLKEVNPVLNAIAGERFEAALQDATKADELCNDLDKEIIKEKYPLLGVPFSVKVTIGVKGLPIHGGVYSRRFIISDEDAVVVKNLRASGAIPICVTNVPEWGLGFESHNKIHGHTLNPYDTRRCPGGSSGGETSLIGSAASLFGIGSDFMGSCRHPAMFCGVFGHRPTRPIISNEGLIPVIPDPTVEYILSIGPMCRYAKDLPVILKAMAGSDSKMMNFDTCIEMKALNVYYPVNYGKYSYEKIKIEKEILDGMTSVVQELSSAGATANIINIPFDGLFDRIAAKYMLIDKHLMTRFSDIPLKRGAIHREYFKWIAGKSNHCLNAIHADFMIRRYEHHISEKLREKYRKVLDEYEKELKVT